MNTNTGNNNNTGNTFADSILGDIFGGVKHTENLEGVHAMLDKYGLNWKVSKEPLCLPNGSPTAFFGVVRKDNNAVFATCKESYVPFQNSELAEMLIRLSEKTGYALHGGGMFNGGGKVYMQLESPNKLQGIGENRDRVNGYLTGINGHDTSTALKWGETNITISCHNTFMAAMRAIKNSARHTESIHDRIEQAIREINGVVEQEKSLFDTFIKLAEVPVTKPAIARIVKDVTTVDITLTKAELEKNYTTYAVNRSQELLQAIAKEMKQKGETMWGLMSGVTQYTTHVIPVPKRDNARLESLYTGTAYNVNNESFATIKQLAGLATN